MGAVPDPDGAVVLERGHDFDFCPNTPHLFILNAESPPPTQSWRDEIFPLLHRLDILASVDVCNEYRKTLSNVIVTCHPPFNQTKSLPLTIQSSMPSDTNNKVMLTFGVVSILIFACTMAQTAFAAVGWRDGKYGFRFRIGRAAEGVAGDRRPTDEEARQPR